LKRYYCCKSYTIDLKLFYGLKRQDGQGLPIFFINDQPMNV